MQQKLDTSLAPDQAVDRLDSLHSAATSALRRALERYVAHRAPPTPAQRRKFRYPELCLTWAPNGPAPVTRRAWAKIQAPGSYVTVEIAPTDNGGTEVLVEHANIACDDAGDLELGWNLSLDSLVKYLGG